MPASRFKLQSAGSPGVGRRVRRSRQNAPPPGRGITNRRASSSAPVQATGVICLRCKCSRLKVGTSSLLSASLVTRNQFPNLWDKIYRNIHDCSDRRVQSGFCFSHSLHLGLQFIVLEHSFYALFVPARRELGLFANTGFRRLRHLYASKGLPRRSYAVITNTLFGSASGT